MGPGGRGDASTPHAGAPGLQEVQSPLTGVKAPRGTALLPAPHRPGAEPSSGPAHDVTKAPGGEMSISGPPKGREKSPSRTRPVMQTQISRAGFTF